MLSDLEKLKALRNGIAIGAIAAVSAAPAQTTEKQSEDRKIKTENIMPRANTRIEPATLKLSPQDIQRAQAAQNIWRDSETKPVVTAPAEEFIRPAAEQKVVPQEAPVQEDIRERFEPLSAPELQGLDTEMRFSKPEERKTPNDYLSEAEQDRKYEYTEFIQNYEDFHKELYKAQLDLDDKRFREKEKKLITFDEYALSDNNEDLRLAIEKGELELVLDKDLERLRNKKVDESFYEACYLSENSDDFQKPPYKALLDLQPYNEQAEKLLHEKAGDNDALKAIIDEKIHGEHSAHSEKSDEEVNSKIVEIFNPKGRIIDFEKYDLYAIISAAKKTGFLNNEILIKDGKAFSSKDSDKKDMMPMFDYLNASYNKAIKEYPHGAVQTDVNEAMHHMDKSIDCDINHKICTLRGTAKEQPASVKPESQQVQQNQQLPQQMVQQIKNSR